MELFGRILHILAIIATIWFWGACYIEWKKIPLDK